MYKNDGLKLVGGIQEKKGANGITLLLYKYQSTSTPGNDGGYQLTVDVAEAATSEKDFERKLTEKQIEMNACLRSVLTFEDKQRWHFIVEHVTTVEKLHMVKKWASYLQDELQHESPSKTALAALAVREKVAHRLSQWLDSEEKQGGQSLNECIINTNLEDSLLVYSS